MPSAHQSPRSQTLWSITKSLIKSLPELPANPKRVMIEYLTGQAAPYLLLSSPRQSVKMIRDFVTEARDNGHNMSKLTVNTYPNIDTPSRYWVGLDNRVVQTFPGICEFWGVKDTQQLIDQIDCLGLKLCLATTHLRGLGSDGRQTFLADWENVVPALLRSGRVAQVHLEIFRTDLPGGRGELSVREGIDLMFADSEGTDIKRLLRLISNNWRGLVTLEALSSGIRRVVHPEGGKILDDDVIDAYQRVRTCLGRIFPD